MYMKNRRNKAYAREEEAVIRSLRMLPLCDQQFQALDQNWQQRFLDFFTGKKTLPLSSDPFFKRIFHPELHSDRLSGFIGSLLGQKVRIVRALPLEENVFLQEALQIMDVLAEQEDGALVYVEIQKTPCLFPAERISCYSADLLMRQYSWLKGERGRNFKYSDIQKVCTILIFEKSSGVFHQHQHCIHRGRMVFDTGLSLKRIEEYCLVALDVFKKNMSDQDSSEQSGWLSLLAAETVKEAQQLSGKYPWLKEIYREMAEFMGRPEEVLDLFSEAFRTQERNTVQYLMEEQQNRIEEQQAEILALKRKLERRCASIQPVQKNTDIRPIAW